MAQGARPYQSRRQDDSVGREDPGTRKIRETAERRRLEMLFVSFMVGATFFTVVVARPSLEETPFVGVFFPGPALLNRGLASTGPADGEAATQEFSIGAGSGKA